jgi:hypothetical protein
MTSSSISCTRRARGERVTARHDFKQGHEFLELVKDD